MTLKEYLDSLNESPHHFSKRVFLSFNTIFKLYNGGKVRIDTAKKIVRVTKRNVTLKDMGYESIQAAP